MKKKKLKKKGNTNYGNRTVNKSSHNNNTMTNTLLLSSNKISNKKKIKNNNIINTESNKSETKNNLTGKKIKRNKMANKCISKEIIPFSMNSNNNDKNNNNKIKSETKSDINNLNFMINSANNISSNKNFKIYENHIRDYRKTNNKNKEKDEKNNNKDLSDNISQIHNNNFTKENKLVNDKNINSSIESSFLGSIKSNIKKIELNKIIKYFYFWYHKGFYIKIKNRLRSLSKFFKFCDKIKKNKIDYFLKKFKNYQNFVIFLQIKNFFCDNKVKIITKIIIKCYAHIIIRKYHEIVYKRKILRKLKEYLIKGHNKIKNEIQNDIKSIKNENKENKEKGHSISKKNIKFNNKNELIIQLPKNNLVLSATTNKSMLNLFNPIIPLDLNHKERIGYNFTEGKQSNKNVNYNIITKTLKLNLNKKKDTITQNNQLTMVINLVEHLRIKNIKKDPSLPGCFRKWKNNIVNNLTKKKFSGRINEPAVFTDTEDLPKKINLDDHYQSEPETGNKINIHNKYIPVRGVKYFHGKVKQNESLAN